jgi:putative phage-type endonuclease
VIAVVLEMPQRSPEWFAARAGVLTASVVSAIYGYRKDGKETAERRDLRMRLALEQVSGQPIEEPYSNADMQRGNDLEPQARAAYEMTTGRPVREVGFVRDPLFPLGCSPDGLVGDDGLLQIKCPRPANHFETVDAGTIPETYIYQLTHELMLTERAWVDFVSYCPQMPSGLDLLILRHERNEQAIAAHRLMCARFLAEVNTVAARITAKLEA